MGGVAREGFSVDCGGRRVLPGFCPLYLGDIETKWGLAPAERVDLLA